MRRNVAQSGFFRLRLPFGKNLEQASARNKQHPDHSIRFNGFSKCDIGNEHGNHRCQIGEIGKHTDLCQLERRAPCEDRRSINDKAIKRV